MPSDPRLSYPDILKPSHSPPTSPRLTPLSLHVPSIGRDGCTRRSMTAGGFWPTKPMARCSYSSRNGRDHARRFGELAKAIAALPEATLILDGEAAIFDEQLISRFEWL